MLTKNELPDSPIATCMRLFGTEVKMAIIEQLIDQDYSFEQLNKRLASYSANEIEQALEQLYDDDLVKKTIMRGKVNYGMSMMGDTLEPVIDELKTWGKGYQQMMRAAV